MQEKSALQTLRTGLQVLEVACIRCIMIISYNPLGGQSEAYPKHIYTDNNFTVCIAYSGGVQRAE